MIVTFYCKICPTLACLIFCNWDATRSAMRSSLLVAMGTVTWREAPPIVKLKLKRISNFDSWMDVPYFSIHCSLPDSQKRGLDHKKWIWKTTLNTVLTSLPPPKPIRSFFVGIISGVPKYNKLNLNYTYSTKHHAVAVPGNGGWHLLDERLAGDLVCQNRLRVLSFSFWLDIYICRVAFKTVID